MVFTQYVATISDESLHVLENDLREAKNVLTQWPTMRISLLERMCGAIREHDIRFNPSNSQPVQIFINPVTLDTYHGTERSHQMI